MPRRAHPRDVVRFERYQRLLAEGVPDDEAVRRVVCDHGIGLRAYVQDPTRIERIGEIARARARLFRWAAPEALEQAATAAQARLAASADSFVETIEEVAAGDGLRTIEDAAVGRARVEAAGFGLEAIGCGPRSRAAAGRSAVQVNVGLSAEQATAAHVAAAQASERVAAKLRFLRMSLERCLGVIEDAEFVAEIVAGGEAVGLRVRPVRNVEPEPDDAGA